MGTDFRIGHGYDVHAIAPDLVCRILLGRVMELVRGEGWELGNADITIALQRPKLAPYISRMRESLAQVIGCPVEDLSVKATTTEKLGFVGRGEGCEVHAVVLLRKVSKF